MRARFTAPLTIAFSVLVAVNAAGTDSGGSGRPAPGIDASGFKRLRLTLTDSRECEEISSLPVQADAPRGASRPSLWGSRDLDTLWIFDADFEDVTGDNAGWISIDRSGTLGFTNYWHHDTIRLTEPYLGDSTWWCGTYNACWRQPRGYGNDWTCILEREFPLSEWSEPGDLIEIEWDQRYAMERLYDYGYVDVSADGGSSWSTIATYCNPGFQGAGVPQNWDHPSTGHPIRDLSGYAGTDVRVRFRFESDCAYSSQDQYDNPQHSVKDGAWQLDNIALNVNDAIEFYDDSESGNMGWVHEDIPPTGQAGVVHRRSYEIIDGGEPCDPGEGWMMVAYDSLLGRMVDGQASLLVSPAIDISGAEGLVGHWEGWFDIPECSNDFVSMWLHASDIPGCWEWQGWADELYAGPWWGGPFWISMWDDWSAFTGRDWLTVRWELMNQEPAESPMCHGKGFLLDRVRVGSVVGSVGTVFDYSPAGGLIDVFDVSAAAAESTYIGIQDGDGVVSAYLLASDDAGETWEAYELQDPLWDDWWRVPPPVNQIAPATEVWCFFEATDGLGNTSTYPRGAPAAHLEFSILPIHGSIAEPGILLVDKHGYLTPGEDRNYRHTSEYYFREALDVAGFAYDVYDVPDPASSTGSANGPDTSGMKYYDTQIWFANDCRGEPFPYSALLPLDQFMLIRWLSESASGKERNLLLTGSEINSALAAAGGETLSFMSTWLATEFLADDAGDTLPVLRDTPGGYAFMTYDDRKCRLRGGCPDINCFDVIEPADVPGAELVAEYLTAERSSSPAGVAYTHEAMGYQTVNLGFGVEFMMDCLLPNGHYVTGLPDRTDLLTNVMAYFGKEPTGAPTTAPGGFEDVTRLGAAYPNPFNPTTTIEYSVALPGRVTLRVYDLAGRRVASLVDGPGGAGEHRAIWDGRNERGDRVASGVYFVRLEAVAPAGLAREERRIVLLK